MYSHLHFEGLNSVDARRKVVGGRACHLLWPPGSLHLAMGGERQEESLKASLSLAPDAE